mgnify:CR=1 FL=1
MSKELALSTALPTGSIDSYISAAFQLPVLSAEQEAALDATLEQLAGTEVAASTHE